MKHGTSPRTGSSGDEPGATDWSVRGNAENTTKRRPGLEHPGRSGARPDPTDWIVRGRTRCYGLECPRQRREYDRKTPRIGASEAERSTALAPGLDRSGVNPVPRTEASEAKERIRQKDAPDWSIRGGMKHGTSPLTGSSGGEPGATDWSVRGNGENTTKRRPGLERPGRTGARPKPPDDRPGVHTVPRTGTSGDATHPDWNIRGQSGPGMECPGQQTSRRRGRRSDTARRTRTRARNGRGRTRRREDAHGSPEKNARTRPVPKPAPSFPLLAEPSILPPPPKPRALRRLPQPSPPPPTPQPPPLKRYPEPHGQVTAYNRSPVH